MKHRTILSVLGGVLLLSACGGSSDSIRIATGNIVQETSAQGITCEAGMSTGPVVPGSEGFMPAPLICKVMFRTDGMFLDQFNVTVTDVRAAYEYLGQWMMIDGGLVYALFTYQGVPQPIMTGGQIRFTQLTNIAGRRVCAQYAFETGLQFVEGEFCQDVSVGF